MLVRLCLHSAGLHWMYVLARTVPSRGVKSVFYHVRRARDSLAKAGKWCAAEDEQLRKAVQTYGNDWAAVAGLVQRPPADCSDRFRQYAQYQGSGRRGVWSLEEEGQLVRVIEELAQQGKSDISARGFLGFCFESDGRDPDTKTMSGQMV